MAVFVKICGVTSVGDALAAAGAGADAIGLNFWPRSPRRLSPEAAAEIASRLPSGIWKVGVFVNAPRAEIARTAELVGLDAVQLHGDEASDDCRGHGRRVIKAIRVRESEALAMGLEEHPADFLLLDADAGSRYGGVGRSFDWSRVRGLVRPIFLAGGLSPENVAEAVRVVRPFAVDVASGVETAPGKKDPRRIEEFVRHAKDA